MLNRFRTPRRTQRSLAIFFDKLRRECRSGAAMIVRPGITEGILSADPTLVDAARLDLLQCVAPYRADTGAVLDRDERLITASDMAALTR